MDTDAVYAAIIGLQGTFNQRKSAIEASQAAMCQRLGALNKSVSGNGRPGLAQRVEDLETRGARASGFAAAVGIGVGAVLSTIGHWLLVAFHTARK